VTYRHFLAADRRQRQHDDHASTDFFAKIAPLVLLSGFAMLVFNLWLNRHFYHDDSFISLRYALNFVNFGDLSWNVGDKVEGYTNFLHLVLTSALLSLGIEPVPATRIVNAAGAVILTIAVYRGARRLLPSPAFGTWRALTVFAVLSSVTVAVWILGGLETILASGFLACGIVAALPLLLPDEHREDVPISAAVWSGVFFALAYLTRPDSVVINFVAGMTVLIFGISPFRQRIIQLFLIGGIPMTILAIHTIWRLSYYGDVLPNTFAAKTGIDLETRLVGIERYLRNSAILFLPALSVGIGALVLLVFKPKVLANVWRVAFLLIAAILAHTTYVVWSGGDHMPAARVMAGTLGPAALLLAVGLSACPAVLRWPVLVGAMAALCFGTFYINPFKMNPAAYVGLVVGEHIQKDWPAGSVVALNTAGSTPFMAPNNVYIDMLGLNDREIAKRENTPVRTERQKMAGHSAGDGRAVLRREPDFIILGPAEGRPASDPWFLSDLEIAESPEFAECYIKETRQLPYNKAPSAEIPWIDNPLTFTYYRRTC